jgi:hypothetical protein
MAISVFLLVPGLVFPVYRGEGSEKEMKEKSEHMYQEMVKNTMKR